MGESCDRVSSTRARSRRARPTLEQSSAIELFDLTILWSVAFAAAILSAIVGMAGGITFLAVLLLFLPPLVAIPVHGVIQLASNGSRAWIQREHAQTDIVWRYALLLLPMGVLGLGVAQSLPEDAIRLAIGVFVLLATWVPRVLTLGYEGGDPTSRTKFIWLGAVTGFVNVTIGATGPLIAPFFLRIGLTRQALVGTKAACQALGHLAKIAIFGGVGFAFGDHLPLLAGGTVAVVAGTWVGSQLLEHVSERAFVILYKSILTIIALRLCLAAAGL